MYLTFHIQEDGCIPFPNSVRKKWKGHPVYMEVFTPSEKQSFNVAAAVDFTLCSVK